MTSSGDHGMNPAALTEFRTHAVQRRSPEEMEARLDELAPVDRGKARVIRRADIVVHLARVLVLLAILTLWHVSVAQNWVNRSFTASPLQVWHYLTHAVTQHVFWENLVVTLRETLFGWFFGGAAGLIVGLVLGQAHRLNRILNPFLTFANAAPKVALAPILILWFGLGETSKVVLAATVVFFIVEVPTHAAAALADPDVDEVARAMGISRFQRLTKVVLPGIVPAVFGALRLGAVFALVTAVFGEIIAARRGLGQALIAASNGFDTQTTFGIVIVLAFLALLINATILLVERRVLRWTATSKSSAQVASL